MNYLKVLYVTRPRVQENHGGDTVQLLNTARSIQEAFPVKVTIAESAVPSLEGFDLVHFFNLRCPQDILTNVRRAYSLGIPAVLSTIWGSYFEFDRNVRTGLQGFVARRFTESNVEYMKVIGRSFEDIEKKINSDISRKSYDEQFKIAMILKLIITCNIRIGDKKWLTPDTDWVDKLQGDVINNEIKKRGVIIRDKVESKKEEEERKKERIREDARKPTYGASTLKEDHIISQGDKIKIKFTGKSGVENECVITDKKVGKALKELKKEASGDGYLFKVEGDFISPKKINDYLGPSITSKNLRTWICNVEYIKYILQNKRKSKEGNEEIVRVSTKNVSEILHNTPGVCKSSYIHSGITKRFLKAPDDFVAFFTKNGKINKTYIREKYLKFLNRKSRKQRRG